MGVCAWTRESDCERLARRQTSAIVVARTAVARRISLPLGMGPLSFRGQLARRLDPANHCLMHQISALLGRPAARVRERKRRVAAQRAGPGELHGKFSAEIAYDKTGLLALPLVAPGEHAQQREIAGLSFRAARAHDQVLR